MANLLQKASIVLTPTAYDNGKVLCAKPSEAPYGDFDFSRNSAATRVNAQGLVENVQILSSNLVQNGDFSEEGAEEVSNGSFSQEGAELVTNGSFDTDTDWSKSGSVTIGNGKANFDIVSGGFTRISQNISLTNGKTYKINLEVNTQDAGKQIFIRDTSSGDLGGLQQSINLVDGVTSYTYYFTANANSNAVYIKRQTASGDYSFSIDNCSVREVGQDWLFAGGSEITEQGARINNTITGVNAYIRQSNSNFTIGKSFVLEYDVVATNGTTLAIEQTSSIALNTSTVGSNRKIYFQWNIASTGLVIKRLTAGTDVTITNISVKEVLQDWSVEDYGAVSASAVITPYTEGVKLEKTVSADWRSSFLVQPISYTNGSKYKVTFKLKNGNLPSGGNVYVRASYSSSVENIASNLVLTNDWVEYTYYFLADSGSLDISFGEVNWQNAGVGEYFYIDDVSVIEITDDTNLPRINYEGFSYQDALGSELVTNGDFDNGTNGWSSRYDATISVVNSQLEIKSAVSGSGRCSQGITTTIGASYLLKATITNVNSSGISIKISNNHNLDSAYFNSASNTTTNPVEVTHTFIATSATTYIGTSQSGSTYNTAFLDNVSVKEYLGQEVVPDSGCGSWLFEPQSTNLITQSELFSDSSWAKIGTSVTSGFSSPSGNLTAFKLVENSANSIHQINVGTPANGDDYSFSVFVKKGEREFVSLVFSDLIRYLSQYTFDLTNGVITKSYSRSGVTSTFTSIYMGNGWYKLTLSSNYLSWGTNVFPRLFIENTATPPTVPSNTYQGDGTSGLYIWGAMLEQNSFSTSYIPTEGSQVTRNQDVCTNGGSLASINSTEGVLYAEIAALANDGSTRRLSISDGTNNNRILIGYSSSNRFQFVVSDGGSVVVNKLITVSDITQFNKVAFKYKLNDCAIWINGQEVGTDTTATMPSGLDLLNFDQANGTENFFGKTKALAVWKEALSDQELADLTYPTPTDPTFALDFDTIATDFTFARGSEATYVDAQGLIQSTNEIGPELVTNGDFLISGTPSTNTYSLGWYSNTANVSITNGTLILTNSALENSSRAYITDGVSSTSVLATNKSYKLQYEVVANNGVSNLNYIVGSVAYAAPTTIGTHIIYFESGSSAVFQFRNRTTNSNIVFDSVSVKEVITATNTPRLDYSTGAEAFLLEPQSTNLLPYSEDFSVSNWSKGNSSIISNIASSPSGIVNASKLVENTNLSSHTTFFNSPNTPVTSGQKYTMSFFAKEDGRNIRISNAAESSMNVAYNLLTGTVILSGGAEDSSSIVNYGNGWYRCIMSFTALATIAQFNLALIDENNAVTYQGDGTSGVNIWGAQIEQQSYVTSYIPTSGTSVTRNQETCINATPEINSEEGVLYAEIAALADDLTRRRITISDGTTNNRVNLFFENSSNTIRVFIKGVGGNDAMTYISSDIVQFNKVAVLYKDGNSSLWVNGVKRDTSITNFNLSNLSILDLSQAAGSGENFFGKTKDLQVYPKALSDAELIKLTT